MISIISPSKTQDFSTYSISQTTQPRQLSYSQQLIEILKELNPEQIGKLMGISDKLSNLNWQRYHDFQLPFTPKNAKPALLAFKGDVYSGIDINSYQEDDFQFAQQHLRIISGLYGLLRPLDLIQAYRLEMGTRLPSPNADNLYQFWHNRITELLNQDLATEKSALVLNLASNEYFQALQPTSINAKILTIAFKERSGSTYKVVGVYAKRARGLMADFIIRNRITNAEKLQQFQQQNYRFNPALSSESEWVFSR